MKKSTKGAIAASAAGVLLLGGAGTLAYWTAEGDAAGSDIVSGELKLTDGDCDDNWVYSGGAADGNTVNLFVPGDVITKQCTFDVTATGDNLSATLSAPGTVDLSAVNAADEPVDLTADVTADYTIGATSIAEGGEITSANNGQTLTVTFLVDIDYGTDENGLDRDGNVVGDGTTINGNATQSITASLDDITVSLTQNDPNG